MNLVWLDIETTGLNPEATRAGVLELAAVIVSRDQVVAKLHAMRSTLRGLAFDDAAFRMHRDSGLFDDILDGTGEEPGWDAYRFDWDKGLGSYLQTWLCNRVDHRERQERPFVLAGSSVHFDRRWLDVRCPFALEGFSHRNLDVSTLAMAHWYPRKWDKPATSHRAVEDLATSMSIFQELEVVIRGT